MNKIVFELCEEDRQRLDAIIAELAKVANSAVAEATPPIAEATTTLATAEHLADAPTTHLVPPADAPATSQPEPAAMEPAPEVKLVSLGEFQKAVTVVCAKGSAQKQAAKKIINKYAPSVSEVPETKRAEVMAELANL